MCLSRTPKSELGQLAPRVLYANFSLSLSTWDSQETKKSHRVINPVGSPTHAGGRAPATSQNRLLPPALPPSAAPTSNSGPLLGERHFHPGAHCVLTGLRVAFRWVPGGTGTPVSQALERNRHVSVLTGPAPPRSVSTSTGGTLAVLA